MKKITQQEFDALPVVEGWKKCSGSTDYSAIKHFPDGCSFGERCSFVAGRRFEGHKARTSNPYIAIDRAGSVRRKTYFFDFEDGIYVRSGCFFGSLSEFRAKVLEDEGGDTSTVKAMQYLCMANIAAVTFWRRDLIDWGTCK